MKNNRWISFLLILALCLGCVPMTTMAADGVKVGDSFTYTKEDHWGKESTIW